MGIDLADEFVGMYVNDWTLDYGDRGRAAIRELLGRGHRAGLIPGGQVNSSLSRADDHLQPGAGGRSSPACVLSSPILPDNCSAH